MVIKLSNFAKQNLHDFILNSKISNPNIYVKNLVNSVFLIQENPKIGKVLFSQNNIPIRQFIYKKHRIINRLYDNEIHIGAILHTFQDLNTSLKLIKLFFD